MIKCHLKRYHLSHSRSLLLTTRCCIQSEKRRYGRRNIISKINSYCLFLMSHVSFKKMRGASFFVVSGGNGCFQGPGINIFVIFHCKQRSLLTFLSAHCIYINYLQVDQVLIYLDRTESDTRLRLWSAQWEADTKMSLNQFGCSYLCIKNWLLLISLKKKTKCIKACLAQGHIYRDDSEKETLKN